MTSLVSVDLLNLLWYCFYLFLTNVGAVAGEGIGRKEKTSFKLAPALI